MASFCLFAREREQGSEMRKAFDMPTIGLRRCGIRATASYCPGAGVAIASSAILVY